jgi:hypothetical protein
MLMSFYSSNIKARDDKRLAQYVDDVEEQVGTSGIAEKIKLKFNWITGYTSLWWNVQKAGIEKWLWREGVKGEVIFVDEGNWDYINTALVFGPIILGTKKIGGLPGGHIILLTGVLNSGYYMAHDPFGDAVTKYKETDGTGVLYHIDLLKEVTGNKPRFMYWREW